MANVTPFFQCTQDDTFLIIKIRIPNARCEEMEFYTAGDQFVFYAKPYFLRFDAIYRLLLLQLSFRLNLSGELIDDTREEAQIDWNTNEVTVKVVKKNQGEYFQDLDMVSQLLAKRAKPEVKISTEESAIPSDLPGGMHLIEEIDSTPADEDLDLEFDQTVPSVCICPLKILIFPIYFSPSHFNLSYVPLRRTRLSPRLRIRRSGMATTTDTILSSPRLAAMRWRSWMFLIPIRRIKSRGER